MNDKVKHAVTGAVIAVLMLIGFLFVHIPYNWDKGIVFATITAIAVGKEAAWDKWLHKGEPDLYDALATIYGGWGVTFLWGLIENII